MSRRLLSSIVVLVLSLTLIETNLALGAQPRELSISDTEVIEGSAGNLTAVFDVTLSYLPGPPVTVSYTTLAGTAGALEDFTPTAGTLSFHAREEGNDGGQNVSSKRIEVAIPDDALDEDNETFQVRLSDAVNATIADGEGTGTIVDDDPLPALAISDASKLEGDSGSSEMIFTVLLSPESGRGVTVNYSTNDATARGGSDYQSASGSIEFARGERSKQIAVTLVGDTTSEENETFEVSLSGAVNATIEKEVARGTILDDDPEPTVSIDDVFPSETDAQATFEVSLSAASGKVISIDYRTSDETATSGSDYQTGSGTLIFYPGETSKQVPLTINDDMTDEPDETFHLDLTNETNAALADARGTATILDDDAPPGVSVDDVSITEADSEINTLQFSVTLQRASGKQVEVDFSTLDGSAIHDFDYVASGGTLTFAPGATTKLVTIAVFGDQTDEPDEHFSLILANPKEAVLADGEGIATIFDNDAPPSLGVSDASGEETAISPITFEVSLSIASGFEITVDYSTTSGSAAPGEDFESTQGTLTFAPGETTHAVEVPVLHDAIDEHDETFFLDLTNATNASIGSGRGTAVIVDNDQSPSLSIADAFGLEGNSTGGEFAFEVILSEVSGKTASVDFTTADGTAQAPSDYLPTSGTLTIPAGERAARGAVTLAGDIIDEVDETVMVTLSNAINAEIGDGQGLLTIIDDDEAPSLAVNDVSALESNSGTVNMQFTVSLSSLSSLPISVNYRTVDGTAQAGSDYTATSGGLEFAAGESSKQVIVSIKGDTLDEDDETLVLLLEEAQNAVIVRGQGTGTILDNDPLPALSIDSLSRFEGDSTNTISLAVRLLAASGRTVSVDYATADGTAKAGEDYAAANGSLTFSPGQTVKFIDLQVLGDTRGETFRGDVILVNLLAPTNATLVRAQGDVRLRNDDPAFEVEPCPRGACARWSEGDGPIPNNGPSTSQTFHFLWVIHFSGVLPGETFDGSVTFETLDGTAQGGVDYVPAKRPFICRDSQPRAACFQSNAIPVVVIGDTIEEQDETVFLRLSDPVGADIVEGSDVAEGVIFDDDPTLISFFTSSPVGTEGQVLTWVAHVSKPKAQNRDGSWQGPRPWEPPVSIQFSLEDDPFCFFGCARQGRDFVPAKGTLLFQLARFQSFSTLTIDDRFCEGFEHFSARLFAPLNAQILGSPFGTGDINDNDFPPNCLPEPLP